MDENYHWVVICKQKPTDIYTTVWQRHWAYCVTCGWCSAPGTRMLVTWARGDHKMWIKFLNWGPEPLTVTFTKEK